MAEKKAYYQKGYTGRLGYRILHGNPWGNGEQFPTEAQRLHAHPIKYSVVKGFQIGQGLGPLERLISGEKRSRHEELVDAARVIFAGYQASNLVKAFVPEGIGHNIKRLLTDEVSIGDRKISRAARIAGVGAIAWATIEGFQAMEQRRAKESIADASKEAEVLAKVYRNATNEKSTVLVNGQPTETTKAKALAGDYAKKTLADLEAQYGEKNVLDARQRAQEVIDRAFDPANPDLNLQQSLLLVTGDAFESLLMNKELSETAGEISKRPQDEVFRGVENLGAKLTDAVGSARRNPILRGFLPPMAGKAIDFVAGNSQIQAGGVNLDPRAFVNAGSKKTQAATRAKLEEEFKDVITDELGRDAMPEDFQSINAAMRPGVQLNSQNKGAFMNIVLAAALVDTMPDKAPSVAQLCGVLDAAQNRPEVLGQEVADLPSRQRAKNASRRTRAK